MIDNTTAVAVINNMGTCHSTECNSITKQIWEFSILHNITWLTAAYIPGSSNVRADAESRHLRSQDTEWMINPTLLSNALDTLNYKTEIDLFASRLNRQFLYIAHSDLIQRPHVLMHLPFSRHLVVFSEYFGR